MSNLWSDKKISDVYSDTRKQISKEVEKIMEFQIERVNNLFKTFSLMIEFESGHDQTPIVWGIDLENFENNGMYTEPIWIPKSLFTWEQVVELLWWANKNEK